MSEPRTKTDAMRELYSVENRIASNRKTANGTAKATTAKICDDVLPSLQARAAALRAEIETLPEPPPRTFSTNGNFPIKFRTTPLTAEENAMLELPEFLRRTDTRKAIA